MLIKNLLDLLEATKVANEKFFIVQDDNDLYIEKSFPTEEAAERHLQKCKERAQNDLDNDTDYADTDSEVLDNCVVMSGAQLKKVAPKLYEAKGSSISKAEKNLIGAIREFFISSLMDDVDRLGLDDVMKSFDDHWIDLPNAIEPVVRKVMKTEKASIRKEIKSYGTLTEGWRTSDGKTS